MRVEVFEAVGIWNDLMKRINGTIKNLEKGGRRVVDIKFRIVPVSDHQIDGVWYSAMILHEQEPPAAMREGE